MSIVFISDLHLTPHCSKTTALFTEFLRRYQPQMTHLYILGDFFDAWIGDDEQSSFNNHIISLLKMCTQQGIVVYFLHGNRDFLLGADFFKATGATLLPDETVINLHGVPTLIMHGDTLCTQDTAYLRLRKILRNRWVQTIYLRLPLIIRRMIADQLRANSKGQLIFTDVDENTVREKMNYHGVRQLIHGHTHRPGIHSYCLDNQAVKRVVLGAWHTVGSVFELKEDAAELTVISL